MRLLFHNVADMISSCQEVSRQNSACLVTSLSVGVQDRKGAAEPSTYRHILQCALFLACLTSGLSAAPLNPSSYPVLGSLTATQDVIIDTTELKVLVGGVPVTGWTGQVVSQSGGATNLAVFCFLQFTLSPTNTLTIQGTLPAAVLSRSNITLGSNVIVTAGGGAGGARSYSSDPASNGGGAGGGEGAFATSSLSDKGHGGGGGFGGRGSIGYCIDFFVGGGESYGDLSVALEAGSGGGGGYNYGTIEKNCRDGGKGGGGVEFVAIGTLSLPAGSTIMANGEICPPGGYPGLEMWCGLVQCLS